MLVNDIVNSLKPMQNGHNFAKDIGIYYFGREM